MTKILNILKNAFLPILFVSIAFVACEGPEGPAGATGATGAKGDKGDTGLSGAEQCGVCHNNGVVLFEKAAQWEQSLHGEGEIYLYGNRAGSGCPECHTHQGFLEYVETGAVNGPYNDPATINCRTCHKIHVKYDETDWALTKTNDVTFYETAGPKATADLGAGNLCGQCHQARGTTPVIDFGAASYNITSSRFGGHHSPAANVFANNIAWVPTGSKTPSSSNVHSAVADACVTCHMTQGPAVHGEGVGGHTFKTSSMEGEIQNPLACTPCHEEVKTFNDKEGFYDEFKTDMAAVDAKMQELAWRTATGWKATSSAPLVLTPNQAAAAYAYQVLLEDKSNGIHNPKYARAILDNIMEVLGL
ncbi:MAG: hypothetical protein A2X64_09505 [Ignavibacteria bacterium GWF2_33_9]|nr:MAG: hypothetical protein A2X64_09505 [Ignavibacteria bacterium GWF2_33_9]